MPTIPAPKAPWRRVLTTLPLYDILVTVFVLVGGLTAGVLLLQSPDPPRKVGGSVSIGAAIAVAVFNIVKAVIQWTQKTTRDSPHELEGCLYTLYDILVPSGQVDPDLRITVHVPRGDGKSLVQALGYVGSQRKKAAAGRSISIYCGITGRAYRTRKPFRLRRAGDDVDAYLRDLIEAQGFTEEQARSVDHSTMSGYAAPLLSADGDVVGIIYADAVDRDFFNDERVAIVDRACVGIARFIERKYTV